MYLFPNSARMNDVPHTLSKSPIPVAVSNGFFPGYRAATASITLNHIYAGAETTAAQTYTPVFSALVQATGNADVTDSLCQEFLEDLPESQEITGSGRTDECSVSDTSSLYYYDDGEYSWSLSYEGELASASGG